MKGLKGHLLSFVKKKVSVYNTNKELAKMFECSEKTIESSLKNLIDNNYLISEVVMEGNKRYRTLTLNKEYEQQLELELIGQKQQDKESNKQEKLTQKRKDEVETKGGKDKLGKSEKELMLYILGKCSLAKAIGNEMIEENGQMAKSLNYSVSTISKNLNTLIGAYYVETTNIRTIGSGNLRIINTTAKARAKYKGQYKITKKINTFNTTKEKQLKTKQG